MTLGKGSGRRHGAADTTFKQNAEATGFPPESPTLRRKAEPTYLSECCNAGATDGVDERPGGVVFGQCSECQDNSTFYPEGIHDAR